MNEQTRLRVGPLRVFIVDDHPLISSALKAAIESADLQVVGAAETVQQAIDIAPGLRPDVILVDIDLPDRSGLALVRELAPRLPETRILMLTVSSAPADVLEAMRAGASGYLTKGIRPDALVRAIQGAAAGQLAMSRRMAAELIGDLLAAGRPERPMTGRDSLTNREVEVLRLLADGLTDVQIAETLSISPRTAESHVSKVLRKLGVRSRAEAGRQYRGS